MANVSLSSDALLLRHPSEAPRLTSRVTGHTVPLSEEQVVMVTLLGEGPVDIWELVSRAQHHHGLRLDRGMVEAFIGELERWGLLWREEHTSEDLPSGLSAAHPSSGVPVDRTPFTDDDAVFGDSAPWLSGVEDLASDGTEVVAMAGILGQPPAPEDLDDLTSPVNVSAAAWEADVTVDSPETMQDQLRAMQGAAPAAPGAAAPGQAPPPQRPAQPAAQRLPDLQGPYASTEAATRPNLLPPDPLAGAGPAGLLDGAHPYPRLIRRWMPKLQPKSKDVLLTDPSTGARRELKVWEYQLARMMDGLRSPEQVVESARMVGLILHLEEVLTITARLTREEILAPGTTPLAAAPRQAFGNGVRPPPSVTDLSRELEAIPRPFQDLGDSPDSIVDSLLSVPGRQQAQRRRARPDTPESVQPHEPHHPQAKPTDLELSLAMLATFEQQNRHAEAEVALQHLLQRTPQLQDALAAMERLRGASDTGHLVVEPPPPARGLLPWILAGAAGLLLISLLIASLAIKVQTRVSLPCQTTMIQRGAQTAKVGGDVTAVLVQKGAVIRERQPLVQVTDEAKKRRVAALRPLIADKQELLRIMRTTGTVADELKQKRIVATLGARLRTARSCTNERCRRELERLNARIESARLKLKFCEWQAEPDEIKKVEEETAALEKELATLSSQPLTSVVRSTGAGLITSISVAKGDRLSPGARLLTLVDAGRLQVTAWLTGRGEGPAPVVGGPASVRLVSEGSDRTYRVTPAAARPGGPLVFEVPVALELLQRGGACQLELPGEPTSLLASWFK